MAKPKHATPREGLALMIQHLDPLVAYAIGEGTYGSDKDAIQRLLEEEGLLGQYGFNDLASALKSGMRQEIADRYPAPTARKSAQDAVTEGDFSSAQIDAQADSVTAAQPGSSWDASADDADYVHQPARDNSTDAVLYAEKARRSAAPDGTLPDSVVASMRANMMTDSDRRGLKD